VVGQLQLLLLLLSVWMPLAVMRCWHYCCCYCCSALACCCCCSLHGRYCYQLLLLLLLLLMLMPQLLLLRQPLQRMLMSMTARPQTASGASF
jgi:hypothetical protein